MKSAQDLTLNSTTAAPGRTGLFNAIVRRGVLSVLGQMTDGHVTLVENGQIRTFGKVDSHPDLHAVLRVNEPRFYSAVALRGSVGAGEAYMNGLWDCDNLTAVIRIFARNRHLLDSIDGSLGKVWAPLYRLLYALRRNTRSGSRRNIHRHYDLGNEFFQLFLDETLTYSSAYFESEATSLRDASLAKIDRLCDKLELSRDDHLLEIGTGWGAFAIRAAQRHGCRVTTATISREQYNLARERVESANLSDRITVLLKDYRDLEGTFDKLVSVEMIEAVGYPFLEDYFRKCDSLLRPGGRMVLQAITISDEFLETAMRSVDFIKHYIFPGSALPSLNLMRSIIERATRFRWSEVEDITSHYVLTLRLWRERFHEAIERVRAMGYSEEFIRMWDYYFCYCEGGFNERHIGDVQLTLDKSSGEEP